MNDRVMAVALGKEPADLILKNGRVVDVVTETIYEGNIAIVDGKIAGIGDYDQAKESIDLKGGYVTPGFINAHVHVEASMAVPENYCIEELTWGVTTLITDPHEIANVAGTRGIKYMLDAGRNMPINYFVEIPSCVPATSFENAGAVLKTRDIIPCMDWQGVLGLGEMMNVPGVLQQDAEVMQKINLFRNAHRPVDGHVPCVVGRELQAYASQGMMTDHESISWEEAKEKLRAGLAVWVREGSASRNLEKIIKGVLEDHVATSRMGFCTDDKHLADIHKEGTIRAMVLQAVSLGLPVLTALSMATLNPARIYGLSDLGEIAPGKQADLVVWDNLENLNPRYIFYKGKDAMKGMAEIQRHHIPGALVNTVHLSDFTKEDLVLEVKDGVKYPVIDMLPGEIITEHSEIDGKYVDNAVKEGKLCYITVLERHHATGHIGRGLLSGYGLKNGAVATTVAHDSHNLIVVGTDAESMEVAVRQLQEVGGGYTLVSEGHVLQTLPLDVAGLMSSEESNVLTPKLDSIAATAHNMGVNTGVDPFISLSFMALPVIPKLKITDMGMFDVEKFEFCK